MKKLFYTSQSSVTDYSGSRAGGGRAGGGGGRGRGGGGGAQLARVFYPR